VLNTYSGGKLKRFILLISTVICLSIFSYPIYNYESILNPNTSVIPAKSYNVNFTMLPVGGMGFSTNFSFFPRIMFGLSYSATNIVSYDRPQFSKYPGFLVKVLLVEEEDYVPAVSFGISSQGFGTFYNNRYYIKSKGFFVNTSKILYPPLGELLICGGANYSIFENIDEKMIDFFCQAEYYFTDNFGLLLEYFLGLDDRTDDNSFGRGVGYFNIGLKWIYEEKLGIEVDFVDILKNNVTENGVGRSVKITYSDFF